MNKDDIKKSQRFAMTEHPVMQAVLAGNFRFATMDSAVQRLRKIAQQFDSVYDDTTPEDPTVTLWIRGYIMDQAAADQGFMGHFAVLRLKKLDKGILTISAEKLEVPLSGHPIKKRPKQKHPNWGHPVLRNVRKETPYASQKEAQDDLARLHFEYPDVTIPAHADKLLAIVYEKQPGEKPIKKYVFYIREILDDNDQPTGQWRIKCKENVRGKGITGGSKKADMDLAAMAASVMAPRS